MTTQNDALKSVKEQTLTKRERLVYGIIVGAARPLNAHDVQERMPKSKLPPFRRIDPAPQIATLHLKGLITTKLTSTGTALVPA
jgi:hypothetical protein